MTGERPDAVVERWRTMVRAAIPSADLDAVAEIAQHIADRWTRSIEAGLDPLRADAEAEAELLAWRGPRVPSREPAWYRTAFWAGWGRDVRVAARTLRVRPVFTVGAALLSTIAVTAIASTVAVVYGILWRPLAYPSPAGLAVIWQVARADETQISYPDIVDVTSNEVFDARAAMMGGRECRSNVSYQGAEGGSGRQRAASDAHHGRCGARDLAGRTRESGAARTGARLRTAGRALDP
jgi:hypothetical protein